MKKTTVFTPTYNRSSYLPNLFSSLLKQNFSSFEWIIVDDGSSDKTSDVVEEFRKKASFDITYIRQENSGKHIAINTGLEQAKGKLFFIVDSDDYLKSDALRTIWNNYKEVEDNELFCGISSVRCTKDDLRIGGEVNWRYLDCSPIELRSKYKVKGDMAEAWVTSILKKHSFPIIKDEKFCAESLIWNRLSANHIVRYFNEKLYVCEYLDGGLSDNSLGNRIKAPQYAFTLYLEKSRHNLPLLDYTKSLINAWRFFFFIPNRFKYKYFSLFRVQDIIFFLPGLVFYVSDRFK